MADFHAFQKRGDTFLYFTRSARLYQLSDQAAVLLDELCSRGSGRDLHCAGQGFPLQHPPPSLYLYSELRDLLQQELSHPCPSPASVNQAARESSRTFSVYLAQSCNMSCLYCWNRGGSFGKEALLMGEGEARKAADLIARLAGGTKAVKIFVNFYGGEPLLNFGALQVITRELLERGRRLGKKFYFTVDTNGLLLEGERAEFLAGHFALIGVSVDGRDEVHNRQRPGLYGEKTWQRIVRNIEEFPNRQLLGVRATLTAGSDSYLKTFRELRKLGVGRMQLEYCHEPGCHRHGDYQELLVPPERQLAELEEFVDDYIGLISLYKDSPDIPFVTTVMDGITRMQHGNRFTKPCGAGTSTMAINCRGEIFPCISFVERDIFSMGSVGGEKILPLHATLAGFEVDRQEPCRDCWLRYDCAGGCFATHYDMSGHPRRPHPDYCRVVRGKAEIYLYALAKMLKVCPWHLERRS